MFDSSGMTQLPENLEGIIRSRGARLALAVVFIALSAWAFIPYVAYRIAPSAFINAELMRVTAPIAGKLTQDLPRKGQFVGQAENLTLIKSRAPDRRHLQDLERQHNTAKEKAELARDQLAEIKQSDSELDRRTAAYRSGMVDRLGQEIEEATAEKLGCLAEANHRRDVGSRMEALARSGTISQIRTAEALASQEATSTRCRMADARLQRLKIELSAAHDGVFLRDGSNDVPYSQQQRDRLILRRQELQTQLLQDTSQLERLAADIIEERSRLAQMDHFDLAMPASHIVWSVAASPGSAVTEGQTVLDFADCGHRFVAVELPERDFEQIKAGDPAKVRLIGSNEWRDGKVRQVRGSAARSDERLLAAQVPAPNAGNVAVEVAISGDVTAADGNGFCNIGRLAEVRFERSMSRMVEGYVRIWRWLLIGPEPARTSVASN
jgi:multidrug resistance efflux pump